VTWAVAAQHGMVQPPNSDTMSSTIVARQAVRWQCGGSEAGSTVAGVTLLRALRPDVGGWVTFKS